MILHFPTPETLRLAMTSGSVPAEVQIAPAEVVKADDGALWIQPEIDIDRPSLLQLQKLGVKKTRRVGAGSAFSAICWAHIIAAQRVSRPSDLSENSTVIFAIEDSGALAQLVAEMLRLGNDRQGFRHVGEGDTALTLLRVIQPPYYSLLHAIEDQQSSRQHQLGVRAYVERAPRVWVNINDEHEMVGAIDPPAGKLLLVDAPRRWQFIDEGAFQDIYRSLDLRLTGVSRTYSDVSQQSRIEVPLRLASSSANVAAELWVIEEGAVGQLEDLVRRSDDRLLTQLAFAVVQGKDRESVVVRTRPSRRAPPELVLDSVAYRSYLKLPNLFVPVGSRVHPPLRRDAIAKLLADDKSQVTWLAQREDGGFDACSVADSAFRPLSDWVDYVLERDKQKLDTWIGSNQFDFEEFVCKDDAPRPKKPLIDKQQAKEKEAAKAKRKGSKAGQRGQAGSATDGSQFAEAESASKKKGLQRKKRATPSEMQQRLRQLEKEYDVSEEPLDSSHRDQLWRAMAVCNSHLRHRSDTTLGWSNALWNGEFPDAGDSRDWLLSEIRACGREKVGLKSLTSIIETTSSGPLESSLVAAFLVYSVAAQENLLELRGLLPSLTAFFNRQERYLPVRTVWLVAIALFKLSNHDTLGLARTRDRLLERLFQSGLQQEFDTPSFMRTAGSGQGDRRRVLNERIPALFELIQKWVEEPQISAKARNRVYAKLICAFGLAKLGEVNQCRNDTAEAVLQLEEVDPIHRWIARAYEFRIEQAASCDTEIGPLPEAMMESLENFERFDRYKVDTLRKNSRILEPHERVDPYRGWHKRYGAVLQQTLAELKDVSDLDQLQGKLVGLMNEYNSGNQGLHVLATALELAPRLGSQFGVSLLDRVDGLASQSEDAVETALLLQRGLYTAAHFGSIGHVQDFVKLLLNELPAIVQEYLELRSQFSPENTERVLTVEALFVQSFRGLRKLGMREEIGTLYGQVSEQVQMHMKKPRKRNEKHKPIELEGRSMRLLLCVASGWYYFGQVEKATEIADRVRTMLLGGKLAVNEQRALAAAYATAVAQAPIQEAMTRIMELFERNKTARKLPKIEDNMTTKSHFSVSQLDLIETCIRALLGDESAVSPETQRWLDEDEFLVRKRIHRDMQAAMQ